MDCPRCGDPLESYRLGDSETVACGNCSYLGVPVDHKSESRRRESWDDALDRFNDQKQTVKKVTEISDTDVFSTVTDGAETTAEEPDRETGESEAGDDTDDMAADRETTETGDTVDDDSAEDPPSDESREPASADAGN
ncbi:TFIIB-type zinc ribbon-containing protein [Haloarcula halophila]|uniref:TFIIB-type zinc ribbon-containing protein n=1 Tax=Haloarcula TaxID=2237 RepID=UPI0023E3C174|nr:zf-TFIIB domain-containing protein [Halomicroarcula sp. DFY41]